MTSEDENALAPIPQPGDPGHDPEAYARRIAAAERLIHSHVQHLHDSGVIDLDAPARNLIDVLDREYPTAPARAAAESDANNIAAQAGGYWLVGDQGWCNHLT
jgi:hypothetical protein